MDITKVIVKGARVLIKELKNSDILSSGIILPNNEKKQTNIGFILAVGEGAILENGTLIPVKVSPGDKVIYSPYSGIPIKEKEEDDELYLILNERDILAVIQS